MENSIACIKQSNITAGVTTGALVVLYFVAKPRPHTRYCTNASS